MTVVLTIRTVIGASPSDVPCTAMGEVLDELRERHRRRRQRRLGGSILQRSPTPLHALHEADDQLTAWSRSKAGREFELWVVFVTATVVATLAAAELARPAAERWAAALLVVGGGAAAAVGVATSVIAVRRARMPRWVVGGRIVTAAAAVVATLVGRSI